MKRWCFHWFGLGAIGAGFFSAGCATTTSVVPSCCAQIEANRPVSDKSLFQTESIWTTDSGQRRKLGEQKARPEVLLLFYANCQYACPILVNDLRRVEAALSRDERSQVGFTLVTLDPRRDTPEEMASFRELRRLPSSNWTLLRGTPDDTLELAALLGVNYKEEANGQFAHSNLITVLNEGGEIVYQLAGLGQDIEPIVRELRKLLRNQHAAPQ